MKLSEEQKIMRKLYREYKIAQRNLQEHNSIFEKDFDLKNQKAMKGVSESEEEFQKRNKKAWKNITFDTNKIFAWFIFLSCLIYLYYLFAGTLSINVVKYFAGICLVCGLIFSAYLVGGFDK